MQWRTYAPKVQQAAHSAAAQSKLVITHAWGQVKGSYAYKQGSKKVRATWAQVLAHPQVKQVIKSDTFQLIVTTTAQVWANLVVVLWRLVQAVPVVLADGWAVVQERAAKVMDQAGPMAQQARDLASTSMLRASKMLHDFVDV